MIHMSDEQVIAKVRAAFAIANVPIGGVIVRRFPGETIVVVEVTEIQFQNALNVVSKLDSEIGNGFVTLKRKSVSFREESGSRCDLVTYVCAGDIRASRCDVAGSITIFYY